MLRSRDRRARQSEGAEESNTVGDERLSGGEQLKAKRASKGGRETVERDDQPGGVGWTGIASEPLLPGQTPMRSLRSGQGWRELRWGRRRIGRDGAFQPDGLTSDHFEPSVPDATAGPILPEDRSTRKLLRCCGLRRRGLRARIVERPQHRTHPARFARGAALLTLGPQRTGAAVADACGIQDPQGTITLGTPLLRIQGVVGRTPQCSIGLGSESRAGKAMRKRGTRKVGEGHS